MTVTVAVLTGRRPQLLARTLDSFVTLHPDVWNRATRTVVHNSGDPETVEVLDRYRWDDRQVTAELLPIGAATGLLAGQVRQADTDMVMRLEDDWEARPAVWWDQAVRLLDTADQVRLRLSDERVSSRCVVCRRQLTWRRRPTVRTTPHAHFTFNPSLMRTDRFFDTVPADNERDAMRRVHPLKAAQLVPGVFAHIGGEGRSLRKNGGAP